VTVPSDVTGRPPRAVGRPRDERASHAITAAALRQIVEIGYSEMTMESVAAEAGVARATIYRRYRDKGDLVTAAIAADPRGAPPAERSGDPRVDMIEFLRAFDERFASPFVEVIGALMGARGDATNLQLHRERVIEPRIAYAIDLLREAQQMGQIDANADLLLAVQLLAGTVLSRRISGTSTGARWAESAVETVWRGLRPPSRG
jgi:AcrR family transcriptional regulator